MSYMTINNRRVAFTNERNVLSVIRKSGIDLPTFCYHSELSTYGACRMCVVEIEGRGIQIRRGFPLPSDRSSGSRATQGERGNRHQHLLRHDRRLLLTGIFSGRGGAERHPRCPGPRGPRSLAPARHGACHLAKQEPGTPMNLGIDHPERLGPHH